MPPRGETQTVHDLRIALKEEATPALNDYSVTQFLLRLTEDAQPLGTDDDDKVLSTVGFQHKNPTWKVVHIERPVLQRPGGSYRQLFLKVLRSMDRDLQVTDRIWRNLEVKLTEKFVSVATFQHYESVRALYEEARDMPGFTTTGALFRSGISLGEPADLSFPLRRAIFSRRLKWTLASPWS